LCRRRAGARPPWRSLTSASKELIKIHIEESEPHRGAEIGRIASPAAYPGRIETRRIEVIFAAIPTRVKRA
jgi:hypothetical protein